MPYHSESKKKNPSKMKKDTKKSKNSKNSKMPKPMGKPRTQLTKGQTQLMKEHKPNHTPEHNKMMRKLMKQGYCFQQAHDMTMKKIGK